MAIEILNTIDSPADLKGLSYEQLEKLAFEIVDIWLGTEFSGKERHQRRINKLMELEK